MAQSSKVKLVISDFHLSKGKWLPNGKRNPLEDFHQDDRFKEFLEYYSSGSYADSEVELIINGDFFDPLAVVPAQAGYLEYPLEVEEPAAVDKFKKILEAHPVVVAALKAFFQRGKRVVFRWGNHDAGLLWPLVQNHLREVFAPPAPEQLSFQQKPYLFDRILIDHGHQFETLNQFDESNMFIQRKTSEGLKLIQNLPFGSFFVLGFLNRVKLQQHFINQVQPFRNYLKILILFSPIFFFINGARVIWFFIKMRLITHPMRFARFRKTILLMLEAIHRPSLAEIAEERLLNPERDMPEIDTLILGHNHQAGVHIFPTGKQYINTGTWTPITSLEMSTLGHRILRTYALIEYIEGESRARATLKIWHGRPQIHEDYS